MSIIAALDVHSGQVLTEQITTNDSTTFIAFLNMLDTHIDPALTIHLVLDNGSSHTPKATRKWLAAQPRFQPQLHTQARVLAGPGRVVLLDLTRRLLRRGEFTSRQDLADKIENVTIAYNRTAKPYRWTYDGRPLKVT